MTGNLDCSVTVKLLPPVKLSQILVLGLAGCVAGFGVKEHFQNRNRLERSAEDKSDAAWRHSLDEKLDELDFLTVHRLLTNETENL